MIQQAIPLSRRANASARGVATLTMVMILFFVMAMVAAYANRNLIYEQRTSINFYREAASMSAAEAGVDWAMAMPSGGRECSGRRLPLALPASARRRYLHACLVVIQGHAGLRGRAANQPAGLRADGGRLALQLPHQRPSQLDVR